MAGDNQALLLQVSADIKSLEKQFAKAQGIVDKGSRAMEKRAQEAATNLDKFFGKTDPAKALDKVFDATRFKILDSGVAKVGLMGSALESLGATGLVAAAGVGAVAAAFAGAREAAKFADDINDTADRLHVTTDALQEFRYAIRAAGGDEKGADEALEAFSVTLGKASEGLPKALKGFKALFGNEFTAQSVKGLGSVEEALVKVQARMQGLSNTQKDAIVDQFGLTGLKELLEGPVEQMQRLREEAHKVGVVMDADLVKRGGELNDQFETVSKVIDVQLKSALVDIGPVLLDLLNFMAKLAKSASEVVESFKSIEHRRTELLQQQRAQALMAANAPFATPGVRKARLQQVADIDAELAKRAENAKAPLPPKPTRTLADQSKTAAGPRDDTKEKTDAVNATIAQALKDRLQAEGALTDDIEARAETERQIAQAELDAALARIQKQKDEIDADKGISQSTKDRLKKALDDQAVTEAKRAADAKVSLINRDAAFAIEDRQIEIYKATVEAQLEQLQAEADIATTAAQRNAIEKRILDLRQQLERDLQGTAIDRRVVKGELTPEQGATLKGALDTGQAAARGQFDVAHENPIQQFQRSVQDFATTAQTAGVQAMESLSSGLADAIVNAKSLGDVGKNVFRQLIADLLAAAIKKDIAAPLLAFIPGFASGTSFAPGGMALVGERGPELVNLPRGSQVTPTSQTLAALRNLKMPQAMAPTIINHTSRFELNSPVVTEDLLRQMQAISAQSERRAVATSLQLGRRQLPDAIKQHQLLRG